MPEVTKARCSIHTEMDVAYTTQTFVMEVLIKSSIEDGINGDLGVSLSTAIPPTFS